MSARVTACPTCGTKNRVPAAASGQPTCASCKAPLPWIADAGDSDLRAALGTKSLVLVDLWAPWCAPCRAVAPVLERLASRYAGRVKVVKVNVDESPVTARQFDARSIPTLVLVRNGTPINRLVGAQPEPVIAQAIDRALTST